MHVPSGLLSSFVTLFVTIGPIETRSSSPASRPAPTTSSDAALPFDPSRMRD
jgi:hypothetical protein